MTKGIVYRVYSELGPLFYLGCTKKTPEERLKGHIKDYLRQGLLMNKTSKLLFKEYGVENCKIEVLEEYEYNEKRDLILREGYYQRLHMDNPNMVNRQIEGRSKEQWYLDNKQKTLDRIKKNYENNKESKIKYQKEYNQENQNKIKEYQKEYRELNKDKLKLYKSEKITCECGRQITRGNITTHTKSPIHFELLGKKKNIN